MLRHCLEGFELINIRDNKLFYLSVNLIYIITCVICILACRKRAHQSIALLAFLWCVLLPTEHTDRLMVSNNHRAWTSATLEGHNCFANYKDTKGIGIKRILGPPGSLSHQAKHSNITYCSGVLAL